MTELINTATKLTHKTAELPQNKGKLIHKATLKAVDEQQLALPAFAEILHLAEQDGCLTIWYMFDETTTRREVRTFRVIGTGSRILDADYLTHLGTVLMGQRVWHVFEKSLHARK